MGRKTEPEWQIGGGRPILTLPCPMCGTLLRGKHALRKHKQTHRI
jgi:hypothetical protein